MNTEAVVQAGKRRSDTEMRERSFSSIPGKPGSLVP